MQDREVPYTFIHLVGTGPVCPVPHAYSNQRRCSPAVLIVHWIQDQVTYGFMGTLTVVALPEAVQRSRPLSCRKALELDQGLKTGCFEHRTTTGYHHIRTLLSSCKYHGYLSVCHDTM